MITYYDVLGVPADADSDELKGAYYRKAQLLHPDRHATATEAVQLEAESAMKTLNEAWSILKNPEARQQYDLEHSLVDDDALPGSGTESWGRPVAAYECQLCGSFPSVTAVLRQETGKLLWRNRRQMEGNFCRDCGLSLFRATQNRTLITGWWGVISFFVNIGSILGNLGAWRKFHRLDTPTRDPEVVSDLHGPLDPEKPLHRRGGVWFAAAVLFIVGSVAADAASQSDDYYSPSASSSQSSDTWTSAEMTELRTAGLQAGLDWTEADCIVRYITSRYSPSDYIGETAFSNAGDYCL